MSAFRKVMLTGEMRLQRAIGQSWETVFWAYCSDAKAIGITHIQVNFLADPYHEILIEQPNNHYAWFAGYGASLDQFVSSALSQGVYLDAYLAKNRKKLKDSVEIAKAHGLKPVLMLCEPRFMPERLFAKCPHLRGPRVDNPKFSNTPLYSLCTDSTEVREHYQEMLAKLMAEVPELSGISIFTSDSGAGFSHSRSLYAGPNGPESVKSLAVGQRVSDFLKCLHEVGVKINPDFQVSLCSGIEDGERADFVATAAEGVTDEVQGEWSWLGGLEDQWASRQYGSNIRKVGYEKAREERFSQFLKRLTQAREAGLDPIAVCSMPTEGFYHPIVYVPHPYQNIEILTWLRQENVKAINCKGNMSISNWLKYDVNKQVFAEFLTNPECPENSIIPNIAEDWVGQKRSGSLLSAWRTVDNAQRARPFWTHAFGYSLALMPGPLVPDPDGLPSEDAAQLGHQAYLDFESIPGKHRLGELRMPEHERDFMLEQYRNETLPQLRKAVELLKSEIELCQDGKARNCLIEQVEHIQHFLYWQISAYNWCEAGCYLAPGEGNAKPVRSMSQIVDDEIENTHRLISLIEGRIEKFLFIGEIEGLFYEKSPRFVEQLRERIRVMHKHRDDEVAAIDHKLLLIHKQYQRIQ